MSDTNKNLLVESMVDAASSSDATSFSEMFKQALSEKIGTLLNSMKSEISSNFAKNVQEASQAIYDKNLGRLTPGKLNKLAKDKADHAARKQAAQAARMPTTKKEDVDNEDSSIEETKVHVVGGKMPVSTLLGGSSQGGNRGGTVKGRAKTFGTDTRASMKTYGPKVRPMTSNPSTRTPSSYTSDQIKASSAEMAATRAQAKSDAASQRSTEIKKVVDSEVGKASMGSKEAKERIKGYDSKKALERMKSVMSSNRLKK